MLVAIVFYKHPQLSGRVAIWKQRTNIQINLVYTSSAKGPEVHNCSFLREEKLKAVLFFVALADQNNIFGNLLQLI